VTSNDFNDETFLNSPFQLSQPAFWTSVPRTSRLVLS